MSTTTSKQCHCETALCGKCLGINCTDDNCNVHTIPSKIKAKRRILENLKKTLAGINNLINSGNSKKHLKELYDYRRLPRIKTGIEEFKKEIERLEKINGTSYNKFAN